MRQPQVRPPVPPEWRLNISAIDLAAEILRAGRPAEAFIVYEIAKRLAPPPPAKEPAE